MGDTYLHIRYDAVQDIIDGLQFLHFVVQEKDLSAAVQFIVYDALEFRLVEKDDFRLYRDSVGWRRIDNR